MQIEFLNPEGVHEAEKDAVSRLKKALPDSWKGYASLELVDRRQGSAEIDMVIVTADRLIVVELKNWNGDLTYRDGHWFIRNDDRGRSPVKSTDLKRKKLASKIQQKLKGKLNFTPWVDFCVVLCGSSTKEKLGDDEQQFVFSLEEFEQIGKPKIYDKSFDQRIYKPRKPEDRPNQKMKMWDSFFIGNPVDFKAKVYSFNNYVVSNIKQKSIFNHPGNIYQEFESHRRDDSNYKAIMRRWSFNAEGIVNNAQTSEERRLIGYRESKVLGYIDSQSEELKNTHLGLIHVPDPSEVMADFVELYEWPNNRIRLDEFINKNRSKLTLEHRKDLVQIFVSHLAGLHDIDVAHRDIGKHSVWLALPSRVTLSNFVTASYPDPSNESVYSLIDALKAKKSEIPEELYEDKAGTSFTRDVYLAGAVSHYICYGQWPKKLDDGIYDWQAKADDPFEGKLDDWFSNMLHIEAGSRYSNMSIALDELNKIIATPNNNCSLSEIDAFSTETNIYFKYAPTPIGIPKNTSMVMRSGDGAFGIKLWNGVNHLSGENTVNNHLIFFLYRVQTLINAHLECVVSVKEFGFNPSMRSLFVVYDWVEGETWEEWFTKNTNTDKYISIIKLLLKATGSIHRQKFTHGDIHPKNIIISNDSDKTLVRFIDFFDYSNGESKPYSPSYVPDNHSNISLEARDRFAVIKLTFEIANKLDNENLVKHCQNLLEQQEITESDFLHVVDNLDDILNPAPAVELEKFEIKGVSFPELENLLSDEGKYYISTKVDIYNRKPVLKVFLSALTQKVDLHIDPFSKQVNRCYFSEKVSHREFVRNKRYSDIEIECQIRVVKSNINEANELVDKLLENSSIREKIRNVDAALDEQYQKKVDKRVVDHQLTYPIRDVWSAMVKTEYELFPTVTVTNEVSYHSNGDLLVKYSVDKQELDFDLQNDKVQAKTLHGDETKVLGRLSDFGKGVIQISNVRGRPRINPGDEIRLEGELSASSLAKRQNAVEMLMNGHGVISDIADYFDSSLTLKPKSFSEEPTNAELDFYSEYDDSGKLLFGLNEKQREAFKNLYKYGPVSLLQGPPGTGKTAFISSFIHFAIGRGAKRILLVSQSHEAVNNAAEKVRSTFVKTGNPIDIVRLGDDRNVSESLKDTQEIVLQEHYREKFRAELKVRLAEVTKNLGLSDEFSNTAIWFETSFGINLDKILIEIAQDKESQGNINKGDQLKDKLCDALLRDQSLDISFENSELTEVRDIFYNRIATEYGIDSPDVIERFRQLVILSNEWLRVMSSSSSHFQNFLAKTRTLVCGTCVGIGRNHYGIQENTYDWVIIDEAARSSASEMAIAMQVGRRVLLVGDHKQLPPLLEDEHLKAAKRLLPNIDMDDLKRSDFERIFLSNYGQLVGNTLNQQYRMSPAIGDLVSNCFYDGLLRTGRGEPEGFVSSLPEELGSTVTWIDTKSQGRSAYHSSPNFSGSNKYSSVNDYEARTIISLLKTLLDQEKFADNIYNWQEEDVPIGIICMYGEQKKLIIRKINGLSWARQLLEKGLLKVDTVDSYQGKENPIIIVSLVRNNKEQEQGFLYSNNRANVALSRAKERVYIVNSTAMWESKNLSSPFGRVLNHIQSNLDNQCSIIDAQTINKEDI